jgi:hypothetical protein
MRSPPIFWDMSPNPNCDISWVRRFWYLRERQGVVSGVLSDERESTELRDAMRDARCGWNAEKISETGVFWGAKQGGRTLSG